MDRVEPGAVSSKEFYAYDEVIPTVIGWRVQMSSKYVYCVL